MKIKVTFLQHAADVLGDTNQGLTGSQIIAYFKAKAEDLNIEIPHENIPLDVNKRTAILENLTKFSSQQQFDIIKELCETKETEEFNKLHQLLQDKYDTTQTNKSLPPKENTLVIEESFLKKTSEVLGDTNQGLTGTQIIKFFNKKSAYLDVEIPHHTIPFKASNKRTALLDNLKQFSGQQQFEIIEELCNSKDIEEFENLKLTLFEIYDNDRFSELTQSTNIINEEVPTTMTQEANQSTHEANNNNLNLDNTKHWWRKPQYFVPILVAIIGGIFVLIGPIKINKQHSSKSNCNYEIVFIDKETNRTPIFTKNNPRIRVYISTPPMIERIIDGTACIKTEDNLDKRLILVELENIQNYTLVDRKQYFRKGKMEILVSKKK